MEYITFLLGSLVVILIASPIHESGHVFFGWILRMRLSNFKPYPHFRGKQLYMDSVTFSRIGVNSKRESLMYIGSFVFQIIFFFISLLLFDIFKNQSGMTALFMRGLSITYAVLSYFDFPLYALSSFFKLPHLFFFWGALAKFGSIFICKKSWF